MMLFLDVWLGGRADHDGGAGATNVIPGLIGNACYWQVRDLEESRSGQGVAGRCWTAMLSHARGAVGDDKLRAHRYGLLTVGACLAVVIADSSGKRADRRDSVMDGCQAIVVR